MTSASIGELRQHAREYIRLVEAGETIRITRRGRPVAVLAPLLGALSPLERLRAEGEVISATDFTDFPEPLPLTEGAEPISARLDRLRSDER